MSVGSDRSDSQVIVARSFQSKSQGTINFNDDASSFSSSPVSPELKPALQIKADGTFEVKISEKPYGIVFEQRREHLEIIDVESESHGEELGLKKRDIIWCLNGNFEENILILQRSIEAADPPFTLSCRRRKPELRWVDIQNAGISAGNIPAPIFLSIFKN